MYIYIFTLICCELHGWVTLVCSCGQCEMGNITVQGKHHNHQKCAEENDYLEFCCRVQRELFI